MVLSRRNSSFLIPTLKFSCIKAFFFSFSKYIFEKKNNNNNTVY